VHRSGRTARAKREGLSVILIGPEDVRAYRNICRTLNKGENFKVYAFYYKNTSLLCLNVLGGIEEVII